MADGPPPVAFTASDVEKACDEWGCNCGPAAVAAVLGLTLEQLRPHLGDFERKRYTNPTLMWAILKSAGAAWRIIRPEQTMRLGLLRVQWEGPWSRPGVPARVSYRHTHWIARFQEPTGPVYIFDVNCMCVGGWVSINQWGNDVVPWLLKQCEPQADGGYHTTHRVEITR